VSNRSNRPARPNRLRLARLARGLSQEQLARKAGITHQAIQGFEAGRWDPSLRVALRIAAALGTSVEDLFQEASTYSEVELKALVEAGAGSETCQRVELASVQGETVAFRLQGDAGSLGGFRPAGGLVQDPGDTSVSQALSLGPYADTVVVAGCDPAIPLVSNSLSRRDPKLRLLWWPCSNSRAVNLLARGLVHAACVHLTTGALSRAFGGSSKRARAGGSPGSDEVPEWLQWARGAREDGLVNLVHFAAWREGLVLAGGLSGEVKGLKDLAASHARIVNREPGAQARAVLEGEMKRVGIEPADLDGFDTAASGHLQVASAIAGGLARAGIASEPAALAYGLDFLPLSEESCEMLVGSVSSRGSELASQQAALIEALGDPVLNAQLGSLSGYDPSDCGRCA
jgi:putative molybdopterin biosynthesis protein